MTTTGPTFEQMIHNVRTLESELKREADARRTGRPSDPNTPFERLFQSHATGILLIDERSRIVRANRQALHLLGFTHDELTGVRVSDLLHPEDVDTQPLIGANDLAENRTLTLERRYRCKNGRYLPVEVHLSALSHSIMLAEFQDISRYRSTQEALRKANEALDVLYNSAAATVGLDERSRVTFWNPAAERLFGRTRDEVMAKPFSAIPEERRRAVMAGRSYKSLELKHAGKNGVSFRAVASVGPMRNEKKEVVGLIAILFDITRPRQAEEALRQSEQLYRSLVENTQDGYFIGEWPSGRFRFLNQRMCEMLGYAQEEGLALTLWDVIEAGDQAALRAAVEDRGDERRTAPAPAIYSARRKDGTIFRVEISGAAVTFENTPAVQGLMRDVTETARLQAQLQQAQRMESIGTLAGGIAHDFNNLLMAILGNTTLAKMGLDAMHPVYERLDNIVTYVQDASALTKQLLEFARGGKYEVQATALNQLIQKTVQMFGRAKKELSIRTDLAPDLWTVEVDRGQIEQVLLNLLVNAWQAMPDGGRIDIHTRNAVLDQGYAETFPVAPGNYVCISVADTGSGIDEDIQSKIFEPFFTTKDRSRGTGLGLSSAYGIIENHDGVISVHSEVGKGATFNIYLPAVEAPVENIQTAETPEALPGTEKILLVDDEPMILEVGQSILSELGYCPFIALGGREALDIYARHGREIDLVILDMIMPAMSGGETFDRLKDMNGDIKVLLSSGYSLSGEADRILNRGCNGFIQKPFNMEALSRKIREVLDEETCTPGT